MRPVFLSSPARAPTEWERVGPAAEEDGEVGRTEGPRAATRASLRQWEAERGVPARERAQRARVVAEVLRLARPAAAAHDAPLDLCRSLEVAGLDALSSLPTDLHIPGSLCIAHCTHLGALPAGLRVEGMLVAEGCTRLSHIHPTVEIAGDLLLNDCRALSSLPEGLIRGALARRSTNGASPIWDLRGTGVSAELAEKLRPVARVQADPGGQAAPVEIFSTLAAAHAFWEGLALLAPSAAPRPPRAPALLALTEALQRSAHFRQPQVRPTLARRVVEVFAAAVDRDLGRQIDEEICRGREADEDPVRTTLPRLEELCAVHRALRADDPGAALRAAGRALIARSVVREVASAHAASLLGCDSMEVALALAAALAEELPGLGPVAYPDGGLPHIDARGKEVLAREVHRALDARLAPELATWGPLVRYERQRAVDALDWGQVATVFCAPEGGEICPITQVEVVGLAQPVAVLCGEVVTLYERDDLLAWWVQKGTDAMHRPLTLTMLRRVVLP